MDPLGYDVRYMCKNSIYFYVCVDANVTVARRCSSLHPRPFLPVVTWVTRTDYVWAQWGHPVNETIDNISHLAPIFDRHHHLVSKPARLYSLMWQSLSILELNAKRQFVWCHFYPACTVYVARSWGMLARDNSAFDRKSSCFSGSENASDLRANVDSF